MTEARRFLIDDITALMEHSNPPEWFNTVTDEGLYKLWRDLVNLTLTEDLTNG